jgi:hypothetical protein
VGKSQSLCEGFPQNWHFGDERRLQTIFITWPLSSFVISHGIVAFLLKRLSLVLRPLEGELLLVVVVHDPFGYVPTPPNPIP